MPNRILKESICGSPSLEALSYGAEVLFYRLLVQVDDYGRFDGRPAYIRSRCFPAGRKGVSESRVRAWLGELERSGVVQFYTNGDRDYLHLPQWFGHQTPRAKTSKFPDPQADESTCVQMRADAPVFGVVFGVGIENEVGEDLGADAPADEEQTYFLGKLIEHDPCWRVVNPKDLSRLTAAHGRVPTLEALRSLHGQYQADDLAEGDIEAPYPFLQAVVKDRAEASA